jgi:putative ABC transport system permease protein
MKYSIQNLLHRRLRSFLSVLSILIGITSIFAIVSFGLGLQNYINEFAEEAGTRTMFIMARGMGAPGLDDTFAFTQEEVDFVKKINGVQDALGMQFDAAEIESKNQKIYTFSIGLDTDKLDIIKTAFTVDVEKGRRLKEGDNDKVVLGYNYQFDDKIFRRGLDLGDKVEINGKQFEIVGFYEEVGNPQDDAQIYFTEDVMKDLYQKGDKFSTGIIFAEEGVNVDLLADKIEDKLRKRRGQKEGEEDFFVQTFADLLEIYGNVLSVLNGILLLIALISLVVAAVNIMNTMYTAVLERTKEIGVMKAVGAPNSNILLIFVVESGLLGMVGGVLGVTFGYLFAKAGGYAVTAAGYGFLSPVFPWYLTAGCLAFAFFVGAVAGLLPAYQASQLKPVDALRYE